MMLLTGGLGWLLRPLPEFRQKQQKEMYRQPRFTRPLIIVGVRVNDACRASLFSWRSARPWLAAVTRRRVDAEAL
jgi:hypothetical protein